MENIKKQIKDTQQAFHKALKDISHIQKLEEVRVAFLGRKGQLQDLMAHLKSLPLEEKKVIGPLLNQLRKELEENYQLKKKLLNQGLLTKEIEQKKDFDVTAYTPNTVHGTLHILTKITEQLENIFISMGFQIGDGPEVETSYYNFEALNIPDDHPARDMHDTFWLTFPDLLLRTHTSTIQIHMLEKQDVPFAIFAPGRAYRNEAIDASHEMMFMQGEAIFINKNVSIANLLATAKAFLQAFFESKDLKIRVRPGYFPFVEPGLEIDAMCTFCKTGCSICKKTGWIELLGAGLIHPNVLQCSGIDPEKYSGFAFGFGIERLAMVKYGINDIRLFHSDKIKFLNQF